MNAAPILDDSQAIRITLLEYELTAALSELSDYRIKCHEAIRQAAEQSAEYYAALAQCAAMRAELKRECDKVVELTNDFGILLRGCEKSVAEPSQKLTDAYKDFVHKSEVEKAYQEGADDYSDASKWTNRCQDSRARRVVEGTV